MIAKWLPKNMCKQMKNLIFNYFCIYLSIYFFFTLWVSKSNLVYIWTFDAENEAKFEFKKKTYKYFLINFYVHLSNLYMVITKRV